MARAARSGRGRLVAARVLRLALAACAGLLTAAPAALAAVPYQDISSAGPLTHVYVGNELSCQVAHTGDSVLELFPSSTIPADCGTFLFVAGTLYGPSFSAHDRSSASAVSPTAVTPVSQTGVTGAGSSSNPFKVVTVADAGATGLRITQTDTYIVGQESARTDIRITSSGGAPQSVIVYRAGDCYLQGSDVGFGFVEPASSGVGCSQNANNSPAGRIEEWLPITAGARYMEAGYSAVWAFINTHAPFPNTCRCTDSIDNGAGISWSVSVPAGGQTTLSHYMTFSPTGVTGPPPPPQPAAPPTSVTQPPGSCTNVAPNVCLEGPADLQRFGCLRIGNIVHRFKVKLKKVQGGLLVNRVSRVTIVLFALDRRASGSDRTRPFYALVAGAALRPGKHVLRADVRLKVPKFMQKRFPRRFKRTRFRRKLKFPFKTCPPGTGAQAAVSSL